MSGEHYIHHARQAPNVNNHRFFGSPATATTALASSTTDILTMTSLSTRAAAITDVPHAVFLYPSGVLTVNNIDVVKVSYESVWDSVNLTLFCQVNQQNPNLFTLAKITQSKWTRKHWMIEPETEREILVARNGTYAIAPIQAGMEVSQFPSNCNFMLGDANNSTDYTTGVGFKMVSTTGARVTYAMAATKSSLPSTTESGGSEAATAKPTDSTTHSVQSTTPPGAADISPSSVYAAGATAIASAPSSGSLSDGAKAGVSISVILGVFAIIAATIFFMRRKRRTDKLETMETLRNAATSVDTVQSEKTVVEEDPAAAPVPPKDVSNVAFKVVENHRNSEDWRRFFGNGKTPKSRDSS